MPEGSPDMRLTRRFDVVDLCCALIFGIQLGLGISAGVNLWRRAEEAPPALCMAWRSAGLAVETMSRHRRNSDERSARMHKAEYIARLRPTMTPEFLTGLMQAVRTYGWRGDYAEVFAFLEWCVADVAGFPRPVPVDPYEVEDAEWWAGSP